jgi:hypothetical protein
VVWSCNAESASRPSRTRRAQGQRRGGDEDERARHAFHLYAVDGRIVRGHSGTPAKVSDAGTHPSGGRTSQVRDCDVYFLWKREGAAVRDERCQSLADIRAYEVDDSVALVGSRSATSAAKGAAANWISTQFSTDGKRMV